MKEQGIISKVLLLIISLCVITSMIYLFLFRNIDSEGHYNVNHCELAIGETWFDDYAVSNKTLCYEERAYKLNDLEACFKLSNTGECVQRVSLNLNEYFCDKVKDTKQRQICERDLMYDWKKNNKFHDLKGIEKHRISKSVQLKNGDVFLLNPVSIDNNGITFFSHSRFTCKGNYAPPLKINTIGGGPNFIYITNCNVSGNLGTIEYFKYDFSFINYPENI